MNRPTVPFKVGDVVVLKSGGPSMTVDTVGDYSPMGPEHGVMCVWFDGTKKCESLFNAESVERYAKGNG